MGGAASARGHTAETNSIQSALQSRIRNNLGARSEEQRRWSVQQLERWRQELSASAAITPQRWNSTSQNALSNDGTARIQAIWYCHRCQRSFHAGNPLTQSVRSDGIADSADGQASVVCSFCGGDFVERSRSQIRQSFTPLDGQFSIGSSTINQGLSERNRRIFGDTEQDLRDTLARSFEESRAQPKFNPATEDFIRAFMKRSYVYKGAKAERVLLEEKRAEKKEREHLAELKRQECMESLRNDMKKRSQITYTLQLPRGSRWLKFGSVHYRKSKELSNGEQYNRMDEESGVMLLIVQKIYSKARKLCEEAGITVGMHLVSANGRRDFDSVDELLEFLDIESQVGEKPCILRFQYDELILSEMIEKDLNKKALAGEICSVDDDVDRWLHYGDSDSEEEDALVAKRRIIERAKFRLASIRSIDREESFSALAICEQKRGEAGDPLLLKACRVCKLTPETQYGRGEFCSRRCAALAGWFSGRENEIDSFAGDLENCTVVERSHRSLSNIESAAAKIQTKSSSKLSSKSTPDVSVSGTTDRPFSNISTYDEPERDCLICTEEVEEGDNVILLPCCSHVLHSTCLKKWLQVHNVCPVCRVSMCPGYGETHEKENLEIGSVESILAESSPSRLSQSAQLTASVSSHHVADQMRDDNFSEESDIEDTLRVINEDFQMRQRRQSA
jgi:hypothetical protein